ncbi:hypothetical protein RhoFasB10_04211 [Rhodococcus sp. B10]|nr:hypothetical protein [Rhodococcus sp. B10]
MREDDGRPVALSAQCVEDLRLGRGVDGGGSVVQNQDAWIGQQSPGERDALALTAGQRQATLADGGVVALGQFDDEVVCLGENGCSLDFFCRRVGPAQRDVRGDGVGEQEGLVEHEPDGSA